jgi:hypothetical protein
MDKLFFANHPNFMENEFLKNKCENVEIDFLKCNRNVYRTDEDCNILHIQYEECKMFFKKLNKQKNN